MTTTQTQSVEQLSKGGGAEVAASGTIMLGGRTQSHESTAITRQRTRFATNPATQIPLSRIEQYSRFKSTPIIHQTANCRESDVELRILPTSLLSQTEGRGVVVTDPQLDALQAPKYLPATMSAPQLTAEQRMAGATEPVQQTGSRRLSFTLTRSGTRQSDRTGRRLSTTSSHSTAHSWHGASGVLASLPTPNLLSSLAGAAHYTGNPQVSRQETVRASFGSRDVVLEDQRKQTLEDVLELFCAHPSLEIFERSWHPDAVFEGPLTKSVGYDEYTAQWFALPYVAPNSKTLHHRVLSSTHCPHRIVFDQTQEYTLRLFKKKKTVQSIVTLELDEDGKIVRMEDRWDGEELPQRWGSSWLRRLNGKAMPLFVRVPRPPSGRTATPV